MLCIVSEAPSASDRSRAFRERAKLEADRYGPDPWIFVRELLQNSRDAGANAVSFTVGEREGPEGPIEWVSCYDDGEGMTFEHARRYLFALYASSKEDRKDQAGKFGVGFWSILRFDPRTIVIRSQPRDGQPWAVRLAGNLERAEHVEPATRPGTEILLERPRGDGRLEHRIYDAVWQSARYLHRRDAPTQALPITINGRSANAEFALDAPSASFRRRGVRGVVGLGRAPRVELFCRGLRVRSAACLEDLVAPAGRHTARIRVQFPELPAGLAPQALLQCDALEVMLSRSDARDGRALARLVKRAQRELERLVERQLSVARPTRWYRRLYASVAARFRESLMWRTVAGSLVGATAAVVASVWLWGGLSGSEPQPQRPQAVAVAGGPGAAAPAPKAYTDLGRRYRGPRVDVLSPAAAEPVRLQYEPPSTRLHFAALTFPTLLPDGAPDHEAEVRLSRRYRGTACGAECIDVTLPIDGRGPMRLPSPTGHRIVADSVTLDAAAVELFATDGGHPVIDLGEGSRGLLRYRTTAAIDPEPPPAVRVVPQMSRPLRRHARELRHLAVNERVGKLLVYVRSQVEYDRSEQMAQQHSRAQAAGEGFIDRTLRLGKGDCDVQNGLLVALLQVADVPARLAVGYIGVDGGALPLLHAWVEYRDERGRWHIADASERSGATELVATGPDNPAVVAPTAAVGDGGERPAPGTEPGPAAQAAPTETPPRPSVPTASGSPSAVPVATETTSAAAEPVAAWRAWLWPLAVLALLLGGLAVWLGSRTRRAFKLEDSPDLSRLLQGVLQQPGAFGSISALFHRPLVPLLRGRAISLQRARELAAKGRLYRSERAVPLAERASRSGAVVLDVRAPEGQAVADALGAIDLDGWDDRIAQSWTSPLIEQVNRLLEQRNERWSLRVAPSMTSRVAALDLGALKVKLPGVTGTRVVVLDARCGWLTDAESRYATTPQAAVFEVIDQITDHLDLPEDRRAGLLCDGARAALLESFS